jgi:ELWxxDGT repeat protein
MIFNADPSTSQFGSKPALLTNVNGTLFYRHGNTIWKTDGTGGGTALVSSGISFAGGVKDLVNISGSLFFQGFTFANGTQLWKSDGTPAGTVIMNFNPTVANGFSQLSNFTNHNGTLYFQGRKSNGAELWRSFRLYRGWRSRPPQWKKMAV